MNVNNTSNHPLTDASRFSQSPMWQEQRKYFENKGSKAWQENIVPSYVTSNAWIAQAYARMVMAYWRDTGAKQITIIDLGAGSGQFAFHFLNKMQSLHRRAFGQQKPKFRYVFSDFTLRNIQYGANHPAMQKFIDDGLLDFAEIDVTKPGPIELMASGKTLDRGKVSGPIVLVANYLFDTIPQDAFCMQDGQLYEYLLEHIDRGKNAHSYAVAQRRYYPEQHFNQLLDGYRNQRTLDNGHFLFPIAGLRFIDYISTVATQGLLLLSADKGYANLEQIKKSNKTHIVKHGSLSTPVNYHLIGEYFNQRRGDSFLPPQQHHSLCVGAFTLNLPNVEQTCCAYYDAIEQFSPDDFFTLKKSIESNFDNMTVTQMLAYVKLSGYDSTAFYHCCTALIEQNKYPAADEMASFKQVASIVKENHYDLGRFDLNLLIKALTE